MQARDSLRQLHMKMIREGSAQQRMDLNTPMLMMDRVPKALLREECRSLKSTSVC